MELTYAQYQAARETAAMLDGASSERSMGLGRWRGLIRPASSGSSGICALFLPRVGSSSSVIDHRRIKYAFESATPEMETTLPKVAGLSVVEQMQQLLGALSLNKSQLAQILRVTRPTLYDWFGGSEPSAMNATRIDTLIAVLARARISPSSPLNARFVRRPMDRDAPSLIELLSQDSLDEAPLIKAIGRAQQLARAASERRKDHEEKLRALGFEEPSSEQRKEQLAKNVALQEWPKS